MLVTKDREYKREVKSDMGFFSFSTKDEGSVDETVQHTEINAGGGLTITTAEGIVVQYKETGNVQEDIAQLAQSPGLEWMAEVASRDDVDWQAIQEVHNQWSESNSGIGGPGMQLVSLAMAVALSATGVGSSFAVGLMGFTEGSSMAVAMAAGFNSLVMQAGMQVVQNGGDIGAALEAMASVETVRSLATAMLTAGLMNEAMQLDGLKAEKLAEGASDYDKMIANLAQELKEGAVQAGVNAGVGTAVNGGNLGENLVANLRGAAVSILGAQVANEIGKAYDNGNGDLDYVSHKIAHAALGGAIAAASGEDIASGAIGGAVGEMTGEMLSNEIQEAMLTGSIEPKDAKRWIDAGVDLSKLAAGLAAAASGGDIDTAATTGGNAAQNNALGAAATTALVLCELNPVTLTALVVLTAAAIVTPEEQKKQIAIAVANDVTSLINWITSKYQGLSEGEKQQIAQLPGYDPGELGDFNPGGYGEQAPDVDTGPLETLPEEDANKPIVETIPIEEKKAEDYILHEKSINQLNQEIETGKAPSGIKRIDIGLIYKEQPHVHFEDGRALNKDGRWKHTGRKDKNVKPKKLTTKQKKWLKKNGWKLPNE
ncbi:DUF637 domain-containing protein [Pseudodesulfovibrio sp. zrk46]|uniref:DUF637 domain-containing protein n=1 Tax=Pseudodesulfovibrio sp. zrk46 TaxID=2725288 RepID=UPI001448AE8D|nr:DUF637 domain-containing protein [Pseudodesulfovibrio sp. zrk46]QJB56877.1 DUF637 domain-containing protein [Pseudodesulfovibrio sp. zrk46]